MTKHILVLLLTLGITSTCLAQKNTPDTAITAGVDLDDMDDLDDLLNDLELFLDSLLRPRSYTVIGLSFSPGYYNYKGSLLTQTRIHTKSKLTWAPMLAYYHRSGLGISASGFMIEEEGKLNLFQYAITPSFDYLSNRSLATGISYTRYFSKDSLRFYVSPLQNELSAYFTYRKSWLRPSVIVNYAWGTREELKMRLAFIESLRLRRRLLDYLQSRYDQSVSDISVTATLVHDFYWLQVLGKKDNIRLTPQLLFTSGTQQYGFNQKANDYSLTKLTRSNLLATAREFNLDSRKEFKPLSLGFCLRAEYGTGKFYIQPQCLVDYYFPAKENNWSTIFSVNAGFNF